MKSTFPVLAAGLVGAAFVSYSSESTAAPCAGFNDVDTSSEFCKNVEWIKNRKVTLGCADGAYCPNEAVSRLHMAAFMNRLGTALTPVVVRLDAIGGGVDLDLSPVLCQSTAQSIVDFPRRAQVDGTFSGTAAAGVDVAMRVVWSADNGVTWLPLSTAQSVTYVPASQWSSATDLGTLDLAVGGTARFGVQVSRNGAGSTDLTDSRCQIRAMIGSRDGTVSPF